MPTHQARTLKADLEAARKAWIEAGETESERKLRDESEFLTYENLDGEFIDFHGFRHTFISSLVSSGASVKVAQELARHSSPSLTIGRYSHTRLQDLTGALASLPSFHDPARPQESHVQATGSEESLIVLTDPAQRQAQRAKHGR